jgi:organic hydroperoxide reductase OsmC/OhrA
VSEHRATVSWNRREQPFLEQQYSREHVWNFDGGTVVPAAASPMVVPLQFTRLDAVDPEEAFAAALSSCHMLWFLSLASKEGHVVERYVDTATAHLKTTADGRGHVTKVTLNPQVDFLGPALPHVALLALHERAHSMCFLAASVKCEVLVEPMNAAQPQASSSSDDDTFF